MCKVLFFTIGKYYLVDAGHANTHQFLATYTQVRCHLKEFELDHASTQN